MRLEADRIAALIVVTLGLVLLFVIFPIAIEDIDDGSIRPDVLPNTLAGFLVFCEFFWRPSLVNRSKEVLGN